MKAASPLAGAASAWRHAAGIFTAVIARLDRAVSIPETAAIEPMGRGVLDTRLRGYDGLGAGRDSRFASRPGMTGANHEPPPVNPLLTIHPARIAG